MALRVGELYGVLTLQDQQFHQSLESSGRKFAALGDKVQTGTRVVATALTAAAGATLGLGVSALRVGLDYNKLQQTSRAALTTLLGSAEAANEQMDKLDEFARNSPFAKQVFIQAQQQLIGFGRSAEDVLPILDAVQNAVAATGGSNQQISELVSIIAKVGAAGKITAQDLVEFGNRGVDAATLIGSQMGKTGAQIRADITAGALSADDAIRLLTDGMIARFGGATANIKAQMDGATDRIKGAWRDIGSIIAAPFIDPKGGGRAVEWANKFADALRSLEQKAKPLVDLLIKRFTPGLERVTPLLDQVRSKINAWDISKVNDQLDKASKYAPLISATGASLVALGTNSLPILGRLGLSLNPVVAGIGALVATSPELRGAGRNMLTGLEPLVPVVGDLARLLGDTLVDVLGQATPALISVVEAATPLAVLLGTTLSSALTTVLGAAEPVVEVVTAAVQWFAELPTPVTMTVLALVGLSQLHGPLTAMFNGISTQVRVFNERMAVQTSLAKLSGIEIGKMGAAAAVARVSVSGLGTALKTAFISNPIGLVITGVATAIGFLVSAQMNAQEAARQHRDRVSELTDALVRTNGVIDESIRKSTAKKLSDEGALEAARQLGINLNDVVDAALGNAAAMERVREKTDAVLAPVRAFGEAWRENLGVVRSSADATASLSLEQLDLAQAADLLTGAIESESLATDDARRAARDLMATHREGTDAVEDQTRAINDLIQAKRQEEGATISQREAEIRWTESLREAKKAAKEGTEVVRDKTGALDANAKATIEADKQLINLARSSDTLIESMRRNNATSAELDETLAKQRESFIKVAERMGYTREEATKLADAYGLIPDEVITEIKAEAAAAQKTVDGFIKHNDGRVIRVRVDARGNITYQIPGGMAYQADGGLWQGRRKAFADGGFNSAGQYVPRVSQIARGGQNIVWAEPETGWEAYISGKPSQRARNLRILDEVARRLGAVGYARAHADGEMYADQARRGVQVPGLSVTVMANEPLAQAYAQSVADKASQALRNMMAVYGIDLGYMEGGG